MSNKQQIDLDQKYAELQKQVNGIKSEGNVNSNDNSIIKKILKPPYIFMIITLIVVFIALLYFKPRFIMNVERKEVSDIKTQKKLPEKLKLNYLKLLLFTLLITGLLIGVYYIAMHFTKKKETNTI